MRFRHQSEVDRGKARDPGEGRAECDDDRQLTRMAMAASARTLTKIWDNPDDAEYDRL